MFKPFKSFAVLTVVLGLMAGCSSNQQVEEDPNANVTPTPTTTDTGFTDPGVSTADDGFGAIADVATVFYFEFDSAVLLPAARAALIAHAEFLRGNSHDVRLEGHADERGTREYNMALGERRANAVRDFLVLQGVNSSRIETVSYGEERPVDLGSNETSWAKNRRVELSYK
jgi:peptidoglycan-associated lipoprotein